VVVLSGLLGLVSAIVGLIAAIALNTTPGPAMCVVATLFYFMAVFLSPSKGLIFKYVRNRKQDRTIEKEDIIKYLYKQKSISADSIAEMASKLGIGISNIKRHFQALKKDGLILLSDQIQLTAKGKSNGEKLVRAHRLWETYLVDQVGLDNQEIHEDAEKYEHLLTAELLDQLDLKLGYPTTDPHGSPIPTKRITASNPLLKLKPKSKARISENQINSEIESKLWELGLTAKSSIQMVDIDQSKVIIKRGTDHIELEATLAEMINVD
jgi:Mn-dependent DtxR family transcriptional regulator